MSCTVPPGIETGVFYLVLGGIAFSASWKDLKDYARSHHLEVDYVEIYSGKSGGWLRLIGHDNFLKAFHLFNGAHIKGHSIQAHAQNEKECVVLLYPPPNTPQTTQQQSNMIQPSLQSRTLLSPSACSFSYASASPYISSASEEGFYTHDSYSSAEVVPPQIGSSQQVAFQSQIPPDTPTQYSYSMSDVSTSYTSYAEQTTVRTEYRKVVIKNLPDYMTSSNVQGLVEWALKDLHGYDPVWIEEIVLHEAKPSKSRRHACVLLQSFSLAERIKSCLDAYRYQGKKLSVDFAKEGATPSSKASGKLEGSSRKSDKKSHSSSTNSKGVERLKTEANDTQHGQLRPSTPLVVDGSGNRSKRRH